jgi:hypothetical protein
VQKTKATITVKTQKFVIQPTSLLCGGSGGGNDDADDDDDDDDADMLKMMVPIESRL